jgi:hypothetical protein
MKKKRPQYSNKENPPKPRPMGGISVVGTITMIENMAKTKPFPRSAIMAHLSRLHVSPLDVKVSSTDLGWINVLRRILEQREIPNAGISGPHKGPTPLFSVSDVPLSSKKERATHLKKNVHLVKSFGLDIIAGIDQLPNAGKWELVDLAKRFKVPFIALRTAFYTMDETWGSAGQGTFVTKDELKSLRKAVLNVLHKDPAKANEPSQTGDKRSLFEKITSKGRRMFIPTWMRD